MEKPSIKVDKSLGKRSRPEGDVFPVLRVRVEGLKIILQKERSFQDRSQYIGIYKNNDLIVNTLTPKLTKNSKKEISTQEVTSSPLKASSISPSTDIISTEVPNSKQVTWLPEFESEDSESTLNREFPDYWEEDQDSSHSNSTEQREASSYARFNLFDSQEFKKQQQSSLLNLQKSNLIIKQPTQEHHYPLRRVFDSFHHINSTKKNPKLRNTSHNTDPTCLEGRIYELIDNNNRPYQIRVTNKSILNSLSTNKINSKSFSSFPYNFEHSPHNTFSKELRKALFNRASKNFSKRYVNLTHSLKNPSQTPNNSGGRKGLPSSEDPIEIDYKRHFIKCKQSTANLRLKRTFGISYVKPSESEQKGVDFYYPKLPPITIQGSSTLPSPKEDNFDYSKSIEHLFDPNQWFIIVLRHANHEIEMKDYILNSQNVRIDPKQIQEYILVKGLNSLWPFFQNRSFIGILLKYGDNHTSGGYRILESIVNKKNEIFLKNVNEQLKESKLDSTHIKKIIQESEIILSFYMKQSLNSKKSYLKSAPCNFNTEIYLNTSSKKTKLKRPGRIPKPKFRNLTDLQKYEAYRISKMTCPFSKETFFDDINTKIEQQMLPEGRVGIQRLEEIASNIYDQLLEEYSNKNIVCSDSFPEEVKREEDSSGNDGTAPESGL